MTVKIRPGAILQLIRGTWAATAGGRGALFFFLFLKVVAIGLDLASPMALGLVLGVFVTKGFTDAAMYEGTYWILVYTGVRLANSLCHHVSKYFQNVVTFSARMETLTALFEDLMLFPLRNHMESHSGANLSRLNRSAGAVELMLSQYVSQVVEGVLKLVAAASVLFLLDFRVALNVLGISVISVLAMIAFNKKLVDRIRSMNIFNNRIGSICVDYLVNIMTVKMLGLEKPAVRYLKAEREPGLKLQKQIALLMELKWSATGIGYAIVVGSSLFIYFFSHRGLDTPFEVASVYVLLNYLDQVYGAVHMFTGYYGGIIEAATAYEDATQISIRAEELRSTRHDQADVPAWQNLIIDQLDFSFVPGEHRGIHQVKLNLKKGEKIALVGPSGGGKSTFMKLLGGILEPQSHSIHTDTQRNLTMEQVAAQCLLVPQEPEIFTETVRYNLTMGEPFDDKQLAFFVALCRLEEVIGKKLAHGWDTNLVEAGLNLSVGEKQRLALARGLLRAGKHPVLLLDEPTSSLDPRTEKEIFMGLLYYFTDRTIITACHRLALVPLFDRIIFIQDSRIAEVGTFKELLDQKGAFFRAWSDFERRVSNTEIGVPEGMPEGT